MDNIHRGYIDIRTSFNGFSRDIESPSITDGLFCKCYTVHQAMVCYYWCVISIFFVLLTPREMVKQRITLS